MAELVQRRAGDLDRVLLAERADLRERVIVAVLPAAEIRDAAGVLRAGADGAAKMVWIDLASGRPAPLPEAIAAPLRARP